MEFNEDASPPVLPDLPPLPKFSVITVSFNQGQYIRQNIESVIAQDYPNFEHIVIDGGSTDGTPDILKSYPHLKWVSEADEGQSDALNKGFAKATGHIIAWLNSDDWYPTHIFHQIAEELRTAPFVMGQCQLTDANGKLRELYPNLPRSWFDILKYWIYHSSPSQPSIFFRRELLEAVRYPNGHYVDQNLDYCMDYDLWLRMTKYYPMQRYIPKILSYYRTHETSKTEKDGPSFYREFTELYKRHEREASDGNWDVSFILPTKSVSNELQQTVASILTHSENSELIIVDYSNDREWSQQIWNLVSTLKETAGRRIRYIQSMDACKFQAFNCGLQAAHSPIIAFAECGVEIRVNFVPYLQQVFSQDIVGFVLPCANTPELVNTLTVERSGKRVFKVESILQPLMLPPLCAARRIALLELGGFRESHSEPLALREMLLRLQYKAWHIDVSDQIGFAGTVPHAHRLRELAAVTNSYQCAKLLSDLQDEYEHDSFASTRAEHGFCVVPPPDLVTRARALLSRAPDGWWRDDFFKDETQIREALLRAPEFSPAWYALSQLLKNSSQFSQSEEAFERFKTLHAQEVF